MTTIKAVTSLPKVVVNRYIQDGLRWDKDVYKVKSGGTLHVVNNAADEGPHTFTVVAKKDLPKTGLQGQLHDLREAREGARRGSEQRRAAEVPVPRERRRSGHAADVDKPGDSGVTGPGQEGRVDRPAGDREAGTKLYFMCIIHPWMQAKVDVS